MGRKSIQAIIILLLFAAGCKKNTDDGPQVPVDNTGNRVFVVCEGSLGNGNSALSLYLPDKDSAYEDIYKAVNGQALGDVFQSITRIGNQYFLCVNNSDKIMVINRDTWKIDGIPGVNPSGIIGVNKPRYILPISEDKAYVSSLFSNRLYLLDPKTQVNNGSIQMPFKNPEGMFLKGDTAYIATWDTACSQITKVNVQTNTVTSSSIALQGRAPQDILVDKEDKLWILAGNAYNGKQATLTRYDPVTNTPLKTYSFAAADPIRPVFNAGKDTLYFIEVNYNGGTANNGIYRMNIHDAALPSQPFIAAQNFQYFWALGIQPGTGYIYVGDPKGFTQRGAVSIYTPNGVLVKTFPTGIGPGHFLFD